MTTQINEILKHQNLNEYINKIIIAMKAKQQFKAQPRIVQIMASDKVTDTIINYPCLFKTSAKIGAYIRIIKWKIQLSQDPKLIIYQFQYLSGSDYIVHQGRSWNVQQLKTICQSSVASHDFIILHHPNDKIEELALQPFNIESIRKNLQGQNARKIQFTRKRISED